MSLLERAEKALSGFIHYGGLMDHQTRKLLGMTLVQHLYEPDFDAIALLEKSSLPTSQGLWWALLKRLFQEEALRQLTLHNEELAISVALNALEWSRNTHERMSSRNAQVSEEDHLTRWRSLGEEETPERWIELLTKVRQDYPGHEESWRFYAERLTAESAGSKPSATALVMRKNILEDWQTFLVKKRLKFEEEFLNTAFEDYHIELRHKYRRLNYLGDLMAPYHKYFGELFNQTLGNWNKIPWDKIEEYVDRLKDDPKIEELAALLGRFQIAKAIYEEKKVKVARPKTKWKPSPYGRSEVTGIHHSDQLSAILPSEIALLSHPETEIIFSKKFVEKKLLSFQYRSMIKDAPEVKMEELSRKSMVSPQGPIVMCIDTSGSMFGRPEQVAKAIAFHLVSIAHKQGRLCYLITFSTNIKAWELTGMEKNLDDLVDFLTLSFHGGTHIQPALREALDILKTSHYTKADVLVMSDFILPRVDRDILDEIQQQRAQNGTHFHSLYITRRVKSDAVPVTIFDNHWIYMFDQPHIIQNTVSQLENITSKR